MALILPSHYTRQPQEPAVVDNGNPLTRGLVDAILPFGGTWYSAPFAQGANPDSGILSAQDNSPFGSRSGPFTLKPGPPGVGYTYAPTQCHARNNGGKFTTAAELSMLVICKPTSVTTTFTVPFGYGKSNNNTQLAYIGQVGSASQLGFYVTDDANHQQLPGATNTNWANNAYAIAIGTRSNKLNFHQTWLNGQLIQSATATSTIGTVTFDRTTIGAAINSSDAARLGFAGDVFLCMAWNRGLDPSEINALSVNPWQIFKGPPRKWYVQSSGGTAYTLAAAAGALTLSGSAASFLRDRVLAGAAGALTLSGSTASLLRGRTLAAAAGALNLSGTAETLAHGRSLAAAAGALILGGSAETLAHGRNLAAAPGSLILTGSAATLDKHGLVTLAASSGALSLSGVTAGLVYTSLLFPVFSGPGWPLSTRKERKWKPAYPKLREEIEDSLHRIRGIIKQAQPETRVAERAAQVIEPYLDAPIDWDALLTTQSKLKQLERALITYETWLQDEEDDEDLLLLAS